MPLAPGAKLGHYEILAPIGAGGMGEVYKATDTKLNRQIALKVLPHNWALDPDRLARFQREAHALAALNHPNIAQIYGLENNALIMELIEGETIKGPLPLETALQYARQIAEALEYAHDKGIVHRDLKPANIMITPQGVIKILDFGLAKIAENTAAPNSPDSPTLTMRSTEAGLIMGTASYMSPEQAAGKPVDKRSDIWSFGVVLRELLTGKQLFGGETVSHTLAEVLKGDIDLTPIRQSPIRELLARCLDRNLNTRLRDIGEARIALQKYLANPTQPITTSTKPNWLPWALAAALTLALAASLYLREKPAPPAVVRFEIEAPENTAFNSWPVLSPDGRMIAITAVAPDGSSKIWLRAVDALETRPLPGTEGATNPVFWSPDSRSLAFSGRGLQKLMRIDTAGGPARRLCDISGMPVGSWSRSGVIVFGTPGRGLSQVPASGGACTPITALNSRRGELRHQAPCFLPDGRHFIYQLEAAKPEDGGLYIGSLDKKPEQQDSTPLLSADSGAVYASAQGRPDRGYLLYRQGTTLMARAFNPVRLAFTGEASPVAEQVGRLLGMPFVTVSETGILAYRRGSVDGSSRISWYDRAGKALESITKSGGFNSLELSPDGSRVAFDQSSGGSTDIWVHEFTRGSTIRLTVDKAGEYMPVWSPDGERLVYFSPQAKSSTILQRAASGAGDEQPFLKSVTEAYPFHFAPNGRAFLYGKRVTSANSDLWVSPLEGAASNPSEGRPLVNTQFAENHAKFSPDSRFIAYTSNASGRLEIYVRPFPPDGNASRQWMISTNGGVEPRWSRDGKELFYIAPDSKLMTVPVSTAPIFRPGSPVALFSVPIRLGGISGTPFYRWDVTPDGKKFLFIVNATQGRSEPIIVVQNWQAELKGK